MASSIIVVYGSIVFRKCLFAISLYVGSFEINGVDSRLMVLIKRTCSAFDKVCMEQMGRGCIVLVCSASRKKIKKPLAMSLMHYSFQ